MKMEDGAEGRADVSSLVDVAFLLLIYFLVTSTLMPREGDLEMAMGGGGGAVELPPLEIEITAPGAVRIDGEEVEAAGSGSEVPGLRAVLERQVRVAGAGNSNPVVVLKAADGAQHQRFVDVLNAVSGAGVRDLMMVE